MLTRPKLSPSLLRNSAYMLFVKAKALNEIELMKTARDLMQRLVDGKHLEQDASLLVDLGTICLKLNDEARARSLFSAAIEQGSSDGRYFLAQLDHLSGHLDAALAGLQILVNDNPSFLKARTELCEVLLLSSSSETCDSSSEIFLFSSATSSWYLLI